MNKKAEILEAMHEMFSEKGYNTSMLDLSKKTGIKPQSIYSHFQSKDEIVWLTLSEEINEKFKFIQKKIFKFKEYPCEVALKEIAFSIFEYFSDYTKLRFWKNISFIQNEELHNRCKKQIIAIEAEQNKEMVKIFERGMDKAEIKPGNLEGMLNLYVAMINGILDFMLLHDDQPVDIRAYAENIWAAYWQGIKKI